MAGSTRIRSARRLALLVALTGLAGHAGAAMPGLYFAGFYMDYKNLQISFTNFINRNGTDVPVVILQNAPSAEIYGAEANLEFEVFDNFNFRAGATWLHARYGDNFLFSGVGVSNSCGGP